MIKLVVKPDTKPVRNIKDKIIFARSENPTFTCTVFPKYKKYTPASKQSADGVYLTNLTRGDIRHIR